jgi:hypothetical protein
MLTGLKIESRSSPTNPDFYDTNNEVPTPLSADTQTKPLLHRPPTLLATHVAEAAQSDRPPSLDPTDR